MKSKASFKNLLAALLTTIVVSATAQAAPKGAAGNNVDYIPFKPLTEALKGVKLKPVKDGPIKLPLITWPGDVATIDADSEGLFKKEGLNVELFVENDFAKQVKGVLEGETPYLRCTAGMCNAAAEVFKQANTNLYLIYQLTWSNGGDVLVVRPGINSLADLKGKTIGIQLYGPHMDYLTTALAKAGLEPKDVKIKWLKELTIPTYDTNGKVVDPRTAFEQDSSLDAVMVISPDAAALTGGGNASGGESVKGAKALITSAMFNRVIADTYAVRADWFEKHTSDVQKLTHALMLGQEHFDSLIANKADQKYTQLIAKSADLLFGSPSATTDVESSLADCQWVGFSGNVAFFTGQGTTRNFETLSSEIQTSFVQLGLLKASAPLKKASWDYTQLAVGLQHADTTQLAAKPAFDETKVRAKVEHQIATELDSYNQVGALPPFEIYFKPKQDDFAIQDYMDDFKRVLDQAQTAGGIVFVIEGHNAPDAYNKRKAEGASAQELAEIQQVAKNLSKKRADNVKISFMNFCTQEGYTCDPSQFVTVGLGIVSPKWPEDRPSKLHWDQNRRVVFRPKAVETELDEYTPGK